jgi:L-ascorbate metabolism protein UlaG (beta-lactamase superfamily)
MADFGGDLDLALLPVWGWGPTLGIGHLNPERAARALALLRPRLAIPIHWGALAPIGLHWLRPRFLIDPPYAFQEYAKVLAPEVQVRILLPGESLSLADGGET